MAAHQAPPSLGFSRQEHWSGLPFPSPVHESEVAQSCPTLRDPMDCSLPGFSAHGIFQARVLEWGAIAFFDYAFSDCLFFSLNTDTHKTSYFINSPLNSPYLYFFVWNFRFFFLRPLKSNIFFSTFYSNCIIKDDDFHITNSGGHVWVFTLRDP